MRKMFINKLQITYESLCLQFGGHQQRIAPVKLLYLDIGLYLIQLPESIFQEFVSFDIHSVLSIYSLPHTSHTKDYRCQGNWCNLIELHSQQLELELSKKKSIQNMYLKYRLTK